MSQASKPVGFFGRLSARGMALGHRSFDKSGPALPRSGNSPAIRHCAGQLYQRKRGLDRDQRPACRSDPTLPGPGPFISQRPHAWRNDRTRRRRYQQPGPILLALRGRTAGKYFPAGRGTADAVARKLAGRPGP